MESLNGRSDKHDRQRNAEKVGLKIVNKSESYFTNLCLRIHDRPIDYKLLNIDI